MGAWRSSERSGPQNRHPVVQVHPRSPNSRAGVVQQENLRPVNGRRRCKSAHRLQPSHLWGLCYGVASPALHSGIVSAVARPPVKREGLVRVQLPLPGPGRLTAGCLSFKQATSGSIPTRATSRTDGLRTIRNPPEALWMSVGLLSRGRRIVTSRGDHFLLELLMGAVT